VGGVRGWGAGNKKYVKKLLLGALHPASGILDIGYFRL